MVIPRLNTHLFQMEKIGTKYTFSCVHQTSIKSNNKLIAVKQQILLMLVNLEVLGIFRSLIDDDTQSE